MPPLPPAPKLPNGINSLGVITSGGPLTPTPNPIGDPQLVESHDPASTVTTGGGDPISPVLHTDTSGADNSAPPNLIQPPGTQPTDPVNGLKSAGALTESQKEPNPMAYSKETYGGKKRLPSPFSPNSMASQAMAGLQSAGSGLLY